jgi:hypothetical protein
MQFSSSKTRAPKISVKKDSRKKEKKRKERDRESVLSLELSVFA